MLTADGGRTGAPTGHRPIGFGVGPRLLIAATAPAVDPATLAGAIAECRDWDAVLRLGRAHGVLHQLAVVLKTTGLLDRVPGPYRDRFNGLARQTIVLDRLRVVALAEIIERFRRAGLPFLLLKGLGLAERLYSRPFERMSSDLDILTPAGSGRDAGAVLESLGYRPYRKDFYEAHHFHLPYRREEPPLPTTVEMHWQVTKPDSKVRFDVEAWFDGARSLTLRAGPVRVAPPVEELLYLCHHAFVEGWTTLRHLSDLARWIAHPEHSVDPHELQDRARRCGATLFLRQGQVLCRAAWGAGEALPLPPPALAGRRWLVRHLSTPTAFLEADAPGWWPFRRIRYWAMLDPGRAGFRDLVRRVTRSSWVEDFEEGAAPGLAARAVKLLSLLAALGLCVLPRAFLPAGLGARFERGRRR